MLGPDPSIEIKKFISRKFAWESAAEILAPYLEEVSEYRLGSAFVTQSVYTTSEQKVSQITALADWLLEGQ